MYCTCMLFFGFQLEPHHLVDRNMHKQKSLERMLILVGSRFQNTGSNMDTFWLLKRTFEMKRSIRKKYDLHTRGIFFKFHIDRNYYPGWMSFEFHIREQYWRINSLLSELQVWVWVHFFMSGIHVWPSHIISSACQL